VLSVGDCIVDKHNFCFVLLVMLWVRFELETSAVKQLFYWAGVSFRRTKTLSTTAFGLRVQFGAACCLDTFCCAAVPDFTSTKFVMCKLQIPFCFLSVVMLGGVASSHVINI